MPQEPTVPVATAPEAPPATAPVSATEPEENYFEVDEQVLASLPPEVRQTVVDPLIAKVKTQVKERFTKERESFQPHREKAQALEKLVQDKDFQKWWYERTTGKSGPQAPTVTPPSVVSPEEWNLAYERLAQGDPSALNALQERNLDAMAKQKYGPVLENLARQQVELKKTMEMNDLFTAHPDAKSELDKIRMDPSDSKSPSLLEFALHYVSDRGGKPFEDAYKAARAMADQMKASAKATALGMVKDKKDSVTEAPSRTNVTEENVVEVDTPAEALRKQIEATFNNRNVTYRVKSRRS